MAEDMKKKTDEAQNFAASRKHKSHKKKKSSVIYTVIIAVLVCVMSYSGYQIASTLLRDKKAKNTYDGIMSDFVVIVPDDTEAVTPLPSTEKSGEDETHEDPSADPTAEPTKDPAASSGDATRVSEGSEVIVTVDGSTGAGTEASSAPAASTSPSQGGSSSPSGGTLPNLGVDFARLKSMNQDVCAWLQGQGGLVNYPVVQGRDNVFYLKHLFDGTPNSCGSLFVHCDNRFMQDDVTYIFGHHMYGGAMFGNLKKYDSGSYYWSNPEFKLYTPGKTYVLKIYSVFYGTGNEQITFNFSNEASFNAAMARYAARSPHQPQVNVSYGDKFVCLCTCAYQVTDGRYFVLCKVMN